jgi:hypothetical protein
MQEFRVKSNKWITAIVTLVGAGMLYYVVDVLFFHTIMPAQPIKGAEWFGLILFCLFGLLCFVGGGKSLFQPSTLLLVDRNGIAIYPTRYGLSNQKRQGRKLPGEIVVPWLSVNSISTAMVKAPTQGQGMPATVKAVKILIDRSINLDNCGSAWDIYTGTGLAPEEITPAMRGEETPESLEELMQSKIFFSEKVLGVSADTAMNKIRSLMNKFKPAKG